VELFTKIGGESGQTTNGLNSFGHLAYFYHLLHHSRTSCYEHSYRYDNCADNRPLVKFSSFSARRNTTSPPEAAAAHGAQGRRTRPFCAAPQQATMTGWGGVKHTCSRGHYVDQPDLSDLEVTRLYPR
jgi:hypothetical protein